MFQHPTARPRAHQHARALAESDDGASSSFSDDDMASSIGRGEVLLFAPAPAPTTGSSTVRNDGGAMGRSDEWDVVPAFSLNKRSAGTTRTESSTSHSASSASGTGTGTSGSPRVEMNQSLFPSHDGNGIFLADSLALSEEPPSLYASAIGRSQSHSEASSSNPYSSSDRSSSLAPPSFRRPRLPSSTASASDSVGGSWALPLTEEALSNIPDADSPVNLRLRSTESAVFTSEEESGNDEESGSSGFAGRFNIVGRRRNRATRRHHRHTAAQVQDEEAELERTPHAASAGLLLRRIVPKSSEERSAYPSPPPETRQRSTKRRHRQSGGGSERSQKKSSTSGSVGRGEGEVEYRERERVRDEERRVKEAKERERKSDEEKVWMGKLVGKLVEVDDEMMGMLAREMGKEEDPATSLPTPTPSRATSPSPAPRRERERNALTRYARSELGDHSKMFDLYEEEDDEYDSGMETETETRWVSTYVPPTPVTVPEPSRSISTSSLPLYLGQSQLKALTGMDDTGSSRNLRRTASWERERERETTTAWGGDLEGVVSYWRMILRRMRGVVV